MVFNNTIPVEPELGTTSKSSSESFFSTLILILFIVDSLLGLMHILFPSYTWGQGRSSYFNLGNSLTFASWFASVQLFGAAIIFVYSFIKNKSRSPAQSLIWLAGGLMLLFLSFNELTGMLSRLKLFGLPKPDVYDFIIIAFFQISALLTFGIFLFYKLRINLSFKKYFSGWIALWGLFILLGFIKYLMPETAAKFSVLFNLFYGLSFLFGVTALLASVIGYAFVPVEVKDVSPTVLEKCKVSPFPEELTASWRYIGIGGMTFTIIFIQILLFRNLNIFGDYLTANSIISIALIGIAIGGLIGWRTAKDYPMHTIVIAGMLLPLTIILSLAVTVKLTGSPIIAAVILMFPFIAASSVVTVLLIRTKSHIVYAVDLIGAAAGALLISPSLSLFREEGSIILLALATLVFTGCFIYYLPISRLKSSLYSVIGIGALSLMTLAMLNANYDLLNVIRTKVQLRYPDANILYSKSSLVGRYDVIHTYPKAATVKTYDNGRVIDNMRKFKEDAYKIDPRIPSYYFNNPKILIIGLSGDGITKTAKAISSDVTGIEINPAIVDLQRNELVEINGNSYAGIKVFVMDGKSFVAQSNEKYDLITMMNAHTVRGSMKGKSASPEYLFTIEAMEDYLDHLTDTGLVDIEEPVHVPEQEPAVWKLVLTMKQALLNKGAENPAGHFFIFQWRTKKNNYIQILMKKTPFTQDDIATLKHWLNDIDNILEIEKETGKRLGPIRAVTTVLHSPGENFNTNYARILNGNYDSEFTASKNLNLITDNRPYLFSVDPGYKEEKIAYVNTFIISLLIVPFLISFLMRHRKKLRASLPFVLVVSLSGLSYLLIEVVLIQRFQLYLGSPIAAFTSVLCSLLVFSGLGSLWSGRINNKGLYISIFLVVALLVFHQWLMPLIYESTSSLSFTIKIIITVLTIAPLAFFAGVVFPYILIKSKSVITESAAGMLFAMNAAASALAAPLALSISTLYGMKVTFGTAIIIYGLILILILSLNKSKLQHIISGAVGLLFIGILVFPLTEGSAYNFNSSSKYDIYGISYGRSLFDEDKVFENGRSNKEVKFEWMFWVLKGNGKTILVDTGFDDENLAGQWEIKKYRQPTGQLSKLGIKPEDVTDVIITHAHWDHIGALNYYKNAVVWMQKKELEHMQELFSEDKKDKNGFRFKDYQTILKARDEGRLKLISGEVDIYKGITLTEGGKHTHGSQYVTVETVDGAVVIAGDNAYLYENIRRHKPIGTSVSAEENLSAIRDMHRKAASPFFILPGHDPKVMRWFPEVTDGIVHISTTEKF